MSSPGGVPQFSPPPTYPAPPSTGPVAWSHGPAPAPWSYGPPVAVGGAPPRPAEVVLAATMAVTASLQWLCALSFAWLVASLGAAELERGGETGPIFHILNRFHYRMVDGLAWPLYLLPTASLVLGFCLLVRRPWARIAYTGTGVVALAWSAWLLRDHLIWWLTAAIYIAVATGVVWTRAASAWYRSGYRGRP